MPSTQDIQAIDASVTCIGSFLEDILIKIFLTLTESLMSQSFYVLKNKNIKPNTNILNHGHRAMNIIKSKKWD